MFGVSPRLYLIGCFQLDVTAWVEIDFLHLRNATIQVLCLNSVRSFGVLPIIFMHLRLLGLQMMRLWHQLLWIVGKENFAWSPLFHSNLKEMSMNGKKLTF